MTAAWAVRRAAHPKTARHHSMKTDSRVALLSILLAATHVGCRGHTQHDLTTVAPTASVPSVGLLGAGNRIVVETRSGGFHDSLDRYTFYCNGHYSWVDVEQVYNHGPVLPGVSRFTYALREKEVAAIDEMIQKLVTNDYQEEACTSDVAVVLYSGDTALRSVHRKYSFYPSDHRIICPLEQLWGHVVSPLELEMPGPRVQPDVASQ